MTTFRDAIAAALYGVPPDNHVDGAMARRDADVVLAMPEMEAVRNVLRMWTPNHAERAKVMRDGWGLPESIVTWVLGEDQ